jgi:hypothetical protein
MLKRNTKKALGKEEIEEGKKKIFSKKVKITIT